jgi:SPP1 family predicted phage head-tail adaptor
MISAGILNQRVEVLEALNIRRSPTGGQIVDWGTLRHQWACVRYLRGTSALQQGEMWLPSSISVLMRYTAEITERNRLKWQSKTYKIVSLNGSKIDGTLTIVADLVDEGQQGVE